MTMKKFIVKSKEMNGGFETYDLFILSSENKEKAEEIAWSILSNDWRGDVDEDQDEDSKYISYMNGEILVSIYNISEISEETAKELSDKNIVPEMN